MKNNRLLSGLMAIGLIFGFLLTGCEAEGHVDEFTPIIDANVEKYIDVFTVTFDAIDGLIFDSNTNSIEIKAKSGETITDLPMAIPPVTDTYFGGWFSQKNGTGIDFTSDTNVVSDLIVYPKWIPHQFHEDRDGIFTLTGIPQEFIGKYAIFRAYSGCFVSTVVYGFNGISKDPDAYYLQMVHIENDNNLNVNSGTLNMPVWNFFERGSLERDRIITYSRYLGNDTFGYAGVTGSADSIIEIYDFSLFPVSAKDYGYIVTAAPLMVIEFPSITFSNGSAVKSFTDGVVKVVK